MRNSEHIQPAPPRAGRTFDVELSLRYLSPGAFTILPPDGPPPDPPNAPIQHRLTPTRRHKNQSFSILTDQPPTSRSPSPTSGRVSPFRGRGFNSSGSRHASPAPSPPPPDDLRVVSSTNTSPHHSRIPKIKRRNSSFSIDEHEVNNNKFTNSSPNKRKALHARFSTSLTNIAQPVKPPYRPPPSPRRNPTFFSKTTTYNRQLSPIIGSSPEPSQSMSSPARSRIPKSKSQPPSRLTSPSRDSYLTHTKPPLRGSSGNLPRTSSIPRITSRDPSPSTIKNAASKPPIMAQRSYKNVTAKVNSFSKPKLKVLPKNNLTSDSETDNATSVRPKPKFLRKSSVKRLNAANNNNTKTNDAKNNNLKRKNVDSKNNSAAGNTNNNTVGQNTQASTSPKNNSTNVENNNHKPLESKDSSSELDELLKTIPHNDPMFDSPVKLIDLLHNNTTTVVSSTTSTVTKPLKIDAHFDSPLLSGSDLPRGISPIVDGRVLSATSVSNAMNRMSSTVLDTKTLIKDHAFHKSTPPSLVPKPNTPVVDPNNTPDLAPNSSDSPPKPTAKTSSVNNNHVTTIGITGPNSLEQQMSNNMNKLISPDHNSVIGNSVQKSANDRIIEARTVVAADVKPIQITVREKPSNADVQSGNVRLPVSATNGLSNHPSLTSIENEKDDPSEQNKAKKSKCPNLFTACKDKLSCKNCKKDKNQKTLLHSDDEPNAGCFSCCKGKNKPKNITKIVVENEEEKKKSFMHKINCCKKNKNKIGDSSSCFSLGKRKPSWENRRDSILSEPAPKSKRTTKDCCKSFWGTLFCVNLCCKPKPSAMLEEQISASRRPSMVSKKKSLTPTTPAEDLTPKLDLSLVEHTSHMKAAIPILPICLAWFCLVMNCIAPGTGTIFSGLFCLCFGIPRFSQKDSARSRIGSFIINLFIGVGQCFTVLFCLVGWGWSIWWGVTMVKLSKKYKRVKLIEAANAEPVSKRPSLKRDVERGK